MPTPNHVSCAVRGKAVVVVVGKRFGRCSRFPVLDSGNCPRQKPEKRLQHLLGVPWPVDSLTFKHRVPLSLPGSHQINRIHARGSISQVFTVNDPTDRALCV